MKPMTKKLLKCWHVIFGVVAAFFAFQYFQDGLGTGGESKDLIKGAVWVSLALFMVVPEFISWRKKDEQ